MATNTSVYEKPIIAHMPVGSTCFVVYWAFKLNVDNHWYVRLMFPADDTCGGTAQVHLWKDANGFMIDKRGLSILQEENRNQPHQLPLYLSSNNGVERIDDLSQHPHFAKVNIRRWWMR